MNRTHFKPKLDTLEDRCTPAVFVNLTDSALSITSDNARQGAYVNVTLASDSETGEPLFLVETGLNNNGAITSATYPVRPRVNITTGRYNDFVQVQGAPIDTPEASDIFFTVKMGGGNDKGRFLMNGLTITGNSRVSASLQAGDGNDSLSVDLAGTVDEGSTLNLALDGGSGADTIRANNNFGRLELSGTLNLAAYGNSRRDNMAVDLVFQPMQDKFVQGTFNGYMRGFGGADQLRMTVANIAAESGNVLYKGRIDAGPLDTVTASVGTVIKNARAKKTTLLAVTNELPEIIEV